ncbi:universal stress protein [archaeon]|nr:universal stress protein [archaeon]
MVNKILVPIDGSKAADNALDYAVGLAKKYGDELLILNVVRTASSTAFHGVSIKDQLEAELTEQSKQMIGKRINKVEKMGVKAEALIRHGIPDKEIVKAAKERKDVELVVMGAYGKNFLERQILGSKTEGVLRKMPELNIPVLIVPESCRDICRVNSK